MGPDTLCIRISNSTGGLLASPTYKVHLWGFLFGKECLQQLREQIPQQEFSQWISPLQADVSSEGLFLFAPNEYVLDNVKNEYLEKIESALAAINSGQVYTGVFS